MLLYTLIYMGKSTEVFRIFYWVHDIHPCNDSDFTIGMNFIFVDFIDV